MDWVDAVQRIGFPAAIILGLGWFFYTQGWPYYKEQRELERADRIRERDLFFKQLDKMSVTAEKNNDKHVAALKLHTAAAKENSEKTVRALDALFQLIREQRKRRKS